MLVVARTGADGAETGDYVVAIDAVGVGPGDPVLVLDEGNGARQVVGSATAPVRTVVVGFLDASISPSSQFGDRREIVYYSFMPRPPRLDIPGSRDPRRRPRERASPDFPRRRRPHALPRSPRGGLQEARSPGLRVLPDAEPRPHGAPGGYRSRSPASSTSLHSRFAQYVNRRHERSGTLSRVAFKAFVVDRDAYLLEVVRYIHRNPVKAKLAKKRRATSPGRATGFTSGLPPGWLAVERGLWPSLPAGRPKAQDVSSRSSSPGPARASTSRRRPASGR